MKKIRSLSFDAKTVVRGKFKPSSRAEADFYRALKKVARASGHIVESHVDGAELKNSEQMMEHLRAYSKLIGPWAERQSRKLLDKVSKSNKRAYQESSKAIGTALKLNVGEANVGAVARALQAEQVGLIKSIPLEAGQRAQKIAFEAALAGTRAEVNEDTVNELKKQLGLSTEVAESRAKLIAVTETARANASINQARALAVGAKGYIWRATMDEATRPAHRKMDGKYVPYDKPPHLSDGTTGHAGTFPRCRCYGEPVFDD
jgi:SPP1 gp7 family putative phage head morphogenesis protein